MRFADQYGPWGVVIGAAHGIGAEFSTQLAARAINVAMVDRDDEASRALARLLEAEHGIQTRVVTGDVTEPRLIDDLVSSTNDLEVGLLVCNAALSSTAPWLDTPLDRHLAMVDLNVRTTLILLDRFARPMIGRGRGGVILLSSMSALQGSPMVATYAATKAFLLHLAESLWDEWRRHGVDVIALVPGPTDTPGYRASAPRPTRATPTPMPAGPVVAEALEALGSKPWVVPGRTNKILGFVFSRVLPRRRAVGFMGRTMRAMYGKPREPR